MSDTTPILATTHAAPQKPGSVQQAIARASDELDVDFGYLLAQAQVESSLDADAKARTSSASGLFQFIDSTWLSTVQRHGAALGYSAEASAISSGPRGPHVADPLLRGQILALRNDPQAASLMAGALARDNSAVLQGVLGRDPDAGELYLAHFLGSGGASRFLSALQSNPDAPAATLFPKPAAANRSIFYTQSGAPRSLQGVMDLMRAKIEEAMPGEHSGFGANQKTAAFAAGSSASAKSAFAHAERDFGSGNFASQPMARAPAPRLSPLPNLPKISDLLSASFNLSVGQSSGSAGDHARRAYDQLKAFGL
ncbi:lytic transglycosylase domain-containing protein [Erythrobacter sp. MTPC3]|uniref:lytic transglycosylase domain-containing protein n=1 Tax=Erythrobacter sp. MTPC3 TaxID=3056564 RepID=UPI0036F4316D